MSERYFVVRSGDQWKIRFRDEFFGPYRTRDEALLFAIDAAQELGERRKTQGTQVLIEAGTDRFLTTWTYGQRAALPLG
jgi:hypothetical protein